MLHIYTFNRHWAPTMCQALQHCGTNTPCSCNIHETYIRYVYVKVTYIDAQILHATGRDSDKQVTHLYSSLVMLYFISQHIHQCALCVGPGCHFPGFLRTTWAANLERPPGRNEGSVRLGLRTVKPRGPQARETTAGGRKRSEGFKEKIHGGSFLSLWPWTKKPACAFSLISNRNLAFPYTMNAGNKPEI